MFHTADPVTGTTMLMHDTGTGNYKEESEPLGQRIELTDPSPGFPTEYADVLGNARDPEWQCDLPDEFYGGFFDQPVHCQRKDAQLASFSIYSALRSMEPENPQRISSAAASLAAPGAEGQASPAAASAETTISTQKPSGDEAIPDCDITNCEVNVDDPDIPGFVDAGQNLVSTKILPHLLPEDRCNAILSYLFGDIGSVAATVNEPTTLLDKWRSDGQERPHPTAGINRFDTHFGKGGFHIYGNEAGTAIGSMVFVPADSDGSPPRYLRSYYGELADSGRMTSFISGEYGERFNSTMSNRFIFQYADGLTILVAHVGGGTGGKTGNNQLGAEYIQRSKLVGSTNLAGSFAIGLIGGPGGTSSSGYYTHSHISMFRDGKRVDPRYEFCGGRLK